LRDVRFSLLCSQLVLLCACSSGADGYVSVTDDSYAHPVETVTIDIGPGLESDPGVGVGLNIDVAAGGIWRIATTCDTEKEGFICRWDLVASVDQEAGPLEVVDETTFEDPDETFRVDGSAVRIYMENGTDPDFVELAAPEGAALTLDVILDGFHSYDSVLETIRWVSAGEIQLDGAPSNPTVFEPTEP
jgi:hypothetical protein